MQKNLSTKIYFTLLLVCGFSITTPAWPGDQNSEKSRELQLVKEKIQALQKRLDKTREQKSVEEKRLADIERKMSSTHATIYTTRKEIQQSKGKLDGLRKRRSGYLEKVRVQQQALFKEVQSMYIIGRQPAVKLLLNQQEPSAISRMLAYHGYMSRARTLQIRKLESSVDELTQLEVSIEEKAKRLRISQLREKEQFDTLGGQKKKHKHVLLSVQKRLKSDASRLTSLRRSEKELQQLLDTLQEVLEKLPTELTKTQPFGELKGALGWPTRGRIAARFGERRPDFADLTWSGVLIEGPEGGPVQVIGRGRVVFADWMRGLGLLLIVDHGEGYMSLYGHNQALYKDVGEWVDMGEVVAALGASGGNRESALYFELRHKGKPVNPSQWCAGKPKSQRSSMPSDAKLWYGQRPSTGGNVLIS